MESFLDVRFVKASETDWPVILDLEKSEIKNKIYKPIVDTKELKKYFSKSVIYKVAINNVLVGYCAYELKTNTAEITALLVLKQFRNKGLGEKILKKILEDLREINELKVITSPKNTIALRLYLKYGFIISKWIDNYWQGEPRLILIKS